MRRRFGIKPSRRRIPISTLRSQKSPSAPPSFRNGQSGLSPTGNRPWWTGNSCRTVSVPRRSVSLTKRANRLLTAVSFALAQNSPTLTRVTAVLHRLPAKVKRPLSHLLSGLSPPAAKKRKRGPVPAIAIVDARPVGLDRARALEMARSSPPVRSPKLDSSPSASAPSRRSSTAAAVKPPQSGYIPSKDSVLRYYSSAPSPAREDTGSPVGGPARPPPPPSRLSHKWDERLLSLPPAHGWVRDDPYPPFEANHPALHLRIRSQQSVAAAALSSSSSLQRSWSSLADSSHMWRLCDSLNSSHTSVESDGRFAGSAAVASRRSQPPPPCDRSLPCACHGLSGPLPYARVIATALRTLDALDSAIPNSIPGRPFLDPSCGSSFPRSGYPAAVS